MVAHKKLFCLGLSVAFFAAGILSARYILHDPDTASPIALRAGKSIYTYINPLLLCSNTDSSGYSEFPELKKKLDQITTSAINTNSISAGSIYFRDLTSGKSTGINQNALYAPASLLKVPILIAYLKAAETQPNLLSQKIVYIQEPGQAPPLISSPELVSGQTYTTLELLRSMIIDSDNSAKNILESRVDKSFLTEVFSELDIPSPYNNFTYYQISTRTYALFFRVLYNSTFLSRDMSEKALQILSQTKFDRGLRAGVPASVDVEHKYGYSITKKEPPRIIELSDCGIINHIKAPYLLCVMSRGSDPDVMADYIHKISSTTFSVVQNN